MSYGVLSYFEIAQFSLTILVLLDNKMTFILSRKLDLKEAQEFYRNSTKDSKEHLFIINTQPIFITE